MKSMSKHNKQEYTVSAELTIQVAVPILADSLADAEVKSRELKVGDFVTIDGEFIDEKAFRIWGVWAK